LSLADGALCSPSSSKLLRARVKVALRRDEFYVKSRKLQAKLFSGGGRKILFSEKPDWEKWIRKGFRHLPHHIEFGPITEDSYRKYDIVVPLTLAALEEARRLSGSKHAFPVPSARAVSLCNDKYRFNQAMIDGGFGKYIPRIKLGLGLATPYILKKRTGGWGKECFIVGSREDEQRHLERIADPNYFCQELVRGGTEFATHILFVHGQIVKALNIRYEFGFNAPIKGQTAPALQVVCRCRFLRLWARMLQTIGFEGLCCVNYKVAHRQPFLMEINPRFGGSLGPYFFSFVKYLHA
jgi:predicted ATP-grasp superfamily ATP-dependent carboligase